ncbi:MAG: TonB family protein [Acidobacteriota bacterium]
MPREIFREVVEGEGHRTARQWYTVPLSIVTHTLLIVMFIAIPLLMTDALPTPASVLVFAAPPPPPVATPPDPAVRPDPTTPQPDSTPPPYPTEAPSALVEERPPTMTTIVEGIVDGAMKASGLSELVRPPTVPSPLPPVAPIRPGGVIKAPGKIHDVVPVYPTIAKAAHVQGTVILEATIAKDGSVRDVRVLSAPQMLDDAALTAVRQWRYTPSLLNGQPVEVLMTVTVRFALQ